jgi:NADH dehydrogenase
MDNGILITGGTGAMGRVLVRKLLDRRLPVRVLTLPGDPNAAAMVTQGVDVRFGNIANAADCRGLCDDMTTVLHLAAIIITDDPALYTSVNAGGTRNIVAEAATSGVSHFIHVSSASVVYPKATPYSISKRLAEEMVRKSKVPWTIVRPTLIYGERGGQEFDMFLDYLRRFPVVPFIGNGGSLKQPVFVDDVVDGLVTLSCMKQGTGKVYNFSGPEAIAILDFARFCLMLLGKQGKPIIRLPVGLCLAIAAVMRRTMEHPPLKWSVIAGITQDANLDPAEAMADLGYAPQSLETMLPRCFPRT